MKAFTQALTNHTTTTNGDVAYKSTLNPVLDLFSKGVTSEDKLPLIKAAFDSDPILALKCVLYLRDVRQGQGNRDSFRIAMDYLIKHAPEIVIFLLPYIPEIGRWKDVYDLYGKNQDLDSIITRLIEKHWQKDGLCAKWFPRQSKFHKDFAKHLGTSVGNVRRSIAQLTKVVETQMCNQKWHEITYEHVPSIANKKYSNAFKRNDSSRYEDFLNKVKSGTTKINSSTLYPHEITAGNAHGKDALWKGLPNLMPKHMNIVPIIDLSGSMTWYNVPGTSYYPIDIATGLGLYFAENNQGDLKNLFISFAENPSASRISGTTVDDKIRSIRNTREGYSTNIKKVYDLVLQASIQSGEDIDSLLIVSDMQFNQGCKNASKPVFKKAKEKFKAAGKKFPVIIFWNVNANYGNSPVTQHEGGAILVDGYSPNILKSLFNGDLESYTPLKAMLEVLTPKYTFIDEALAK